jgi:hypothetical protein
MTKSELLKLLEPFSDETEIAVAPTPSVCGWASTFSGRVFQDVPPKGRGPALFGGVVLGLSSSSVADDELWLEEVDES